MIRETFDLLRRIAQTGTISGGRGYADFVTSRIVQAATEPTLLAATERLIKSLRSNIEMTFVEHKVAEYIRVASGEQAAALLAWLRKYPNIAAMIMLLRNDDDYLQALSAVDLSSVMAEDRGRALPAKPYQIPIVITCLSPLAHGGDNKAGNATIFRRCQVLSDTGGVLELPYYSGNAFRGQMRDRLADHLLSSLGLEVSRSRPPVALWFFHAIYAGGVLEEGASKHLQAVADELGNAGAIRAEGVRTFRDHLPTVSLLGAAIGNRILPGRIAVGNFRPRCKQWGTGDLDAAALMEWSFLTRRDDHESYDEHHGALATTECLRAGTVLDGGIDVDEHASELERSALGLGLRLLQSRGMLGAENRRGLGQVRIEAEGPNPEPYLAWLDANKDRILQYLAEIGATNTSGDAKTSDAKTTRKKKE